jgi:hypothetical protein
VTDRHLGGIADRGEVDRGVPRDEEPDVAVDRAAALRVEGQVERAKAGVETLVVRGR